MQIFNSANLNKCHGLQLQMIPNNAKLPPPHRKYWCNDRIYFFDLTFRVAFTFTDASTTSFPSSPLNSDNSDESDGDGDLTFVTRRFLLGEGEMSDSGNLNLALEMLEIEVGVGLIGVTVVESGKW